MNVFLRIAGIAIAIALIALPVVAVVKGWVGAERFPLKTLRVSGELKHVDAGEVRKLLSPYAGKGFFAIDLEGAQSSLAALPWVESAEVSRRWPDVLEVEIVEHRPLALWDEDKLLSERGHIYPRKAMGSALPKGLPQLGGDPARVAEVLGFYNQSRELFAPLGLNVRELRQDARGAWSLRLSDGARVLVGRHDPQPRLRRFAELLPKLIAPQGRRLQRADLRYANGFALQWSEAASPQATSRKTA